MFLMDASMRKLLAVSALAPVLALAGFAGCGAGDVNPPPLLTGGDAGGTDAPTTVDAPPGAIVQTGTIIDLSTKQPVAGAKVTSGAQSATTDSKGTYSMTLDPGVTFSMKVEKTAYYTLQEQEMLPSSSFNLGKTKLPSEQTVSLLVSTFKGYDGVGGIVSIAIENAPGQCPDEGGATFDFTVDGQPGLNADGGAATTAQIVYFSDGFPDGARTSAQSGSFPHAAIYNLPAGKPVVVTAKHPTCKMLPFPVDKDLAIESGSGTAHYVSATLSPFGGKSTGFVRIFLSK
jgi:hypothetical protein